MASVTGRWRNRGLGGGGRIEETDLVNLSLDSYPSTQFVVRLRGWRFLLYCEVGSSHTHLYHTFVGITGDRICFRFFLGRKLEGVGVSVRGDTLVEDRHRGKVNWLFGAENRLLARTSPDSIVWAVLLRFNQGKLSGFVIQGGVASLVIWQLMPSGLRIAHAS